MAQVNAYNIRKALKKYTFILLFYYFLNTYSDANILNNPDSKIASPLASSLSIPPSEVVKLLDITITLQGLSQKIKVLKNGEIDWLDRGPRNDLEWTFFLNRLMFLKEWMELYHSTHDTLWLDRTMFVLNSWLLAHPNLSSQDPGWRAMEAARRLADLWPYLDQVLISRPDFPETIRNRFKATILLHALCCQKYHAISGNHLLTEMLGLASAAIHWSEFNEASQWWAFAVNEIEKSVVDQTFIDGAQKELSVMYQIYTLETLVRFQELAIQRKTKLSLNAESLIIQMSQYLEKICAQNSQGIQNNDSDLLPLQKRFVQLQNQYPWIKKPQDPILNKPFYTLLFPYAGQWINFSRETNLTKWIFFDYGPAGIAHQHRDRLSVSFQVNENRYLIDPGRYTYKKDVWRRYFTGSSAHNILHPIGSNQYWGPTDQPIELIESVQTDEFSYILGEHRWGYQSEQRSSITRRAVINLPQGPLIVIDAWVGFYPVTLETLWHFDPQILLEKNSEELNCRRISMPILFLTPPLNGEIAIVQGVPPPYPQGWTSDSYNQRAPAPVVVAHQKTSVPAVNLWIFNFNHKISKYDVMQRQKNGWIQFKIPKGSNSFIKISLRFWGKLKFPFEIDKAISSDENNVKSFFIEDIHTNP